MRRLVAMLALAALGGGAAATVGVTLELAAERRSREARARVLDDAAAAGRTALAENLARDERSAMAACEVLPILLSGGADGLRLALRSTGTIDGWVAVFDRADPALPWTALAITRFGSPPGPFLEPSESMRLDDGPPRLPGSPAVALDRSTGRVECWDATDTHAIVVTRSVDPRLLPEWPPSGPRIELVDPDAVRPDHIAELRWIEEPTPGAPRFAVVLDRDDDASANAGASAWALYAGLFAALGAALGAWLGGARSGSPLGSAAIAAAAERVGKGDLDVTLSGADGDATVSAFNRMTRELREARTRATRTERVAAWRETARRVAHEIKNPLTPIRMAIETLRKARARNHPDEAEIFEESTRAVLEEVNRLDKIVSDFGKFAKLPRPKPEDVDVRALAAHVVSLAGLPGDVTATDGAQKTDVALKVEGEIPIVRADKEQLSQVLTNLVHNALDAARAAHAGGGRVRVSLAPADNGGVRIAVEDDGPGIPTDEREKVLEPYFTTKPTGTGLGLAIVDRIVSEHDGTLAFGRSESLGGASVIVTLRAEGPTRHGDSSRPSAP